MVRRRKQMAFSVPELFTAAVGSADVEDHGVILTLEELHHHVFRILSNTGDSHRLGRAKRLLERYRGEGKVSLLPRFQDKSTRVQSTRGRTVQTPTRDDTQITSWPHSRTESVAQELLHSFIEFGSVILRYHCRINRCRQLAPDGQCFLTQTSRAGGIN